MRRIEIDEDVFEYLQRSAVPFEDTPNTVLRRILGIDKSQPPLKEDAMSATPNSAKPKTTPVAAGLLAKNVLQREFGGQFSKVGRFKTLYADGSRLVYFQNFNKKGSTTLWYRLSGSAWSQLKSQPSDSFVCLTNPAEQYVYVLPVADILDSLGTAGEPDDSVEVNIVVADHRWKWRGLNWNLKQYYKQY